MKRVAIIAGEPSGDVIGAGLVLQIKKHYPDCEIVGMAGDAMQSNGMTAWYHVDDLSVMGITEVIKVLPKILRIRKDLTQRIKDFQPDVMIGIDAPDFNLSIEKKLKASGIKTAHYVSPSIWAWKSWRIHKIKKATDLVLCTLPFELEIYQKHHHPAAFVGHPLADQIDFTLGKVDYCHQLGLDPAKNYVALLPGSRGFELKQLLSVFIKAAELFQQQQSSVQFLLPLARPGLREHLEPYMARIEALGVTLVDGQAQAVLGASTAALLASGTVALEAALLDVPSVMAYRVSALTYWIGSKMVKLKYFTLPNIILNEIFMPEFIQKAVTAEALCASLLTQYMQGLDQLDPRVEKIRQLLARNASEQAFKQIQLLCS